MTFRKCCVWLRKILVIVTLTSTAVYLSIKHSSGEIAVNVHTKRYSHPHQHESAASSLVWLVHIPRQHANYSNNLNQIERIANDLQLLNMGQAGDFDNYYIMSHGLPSKRQGNLTIQSVHSEHMVEYNISYIDAMIKDIESRLEAYPSIQWFAHQKILSREKRVYRREFMPFNDPYYKSQWHLTNTFERGMDVNVTGVWKHNITGAGVTVAVVDDGVEWSNPDLLLNYNREGSWDLNDDDNDPMPNPAKLTNHHGTRCAGEISAIPNQVCGVGVSYGAKFSGLRLLDGPLTDSLEAEAFNKFFQINDIYSCSWGPADDGMTVDGPAHLAAAAMKKGIDFGRHGYGSIYVLASGNGGHEGDNCNYDGYANSLYTVTIGAVDERGEMPSYAEECASMLAVTFSNGWNRDIVTTDWTLGGESREGCTQHHSGTSAAAPIAAALIALMLEVQPCLTWRDVQYIIVLTAQKVDMDVAHWQKNAAGFWHSHKHGFGLMNAWRLAAAASVWEQVPWLTSFSYEQRDVNYPIGKGRQSALVISYVVSDDNVKGYGLYIIETVYVTLTITHPHRGHLDIRLISPHGTVSVIGAPRPKDNSSAGFNQWTFSTVGCWGESPIGNWTLQITDIDAIADYSVGILKSWMLKLYGAPMTHEQLQDRRRSIQVAMDTPELKKNHRCSPPPVTAPPDAFISVKTIKMITMLGSFCFLFAIYESLEYLLCYNDEKKEQSKLTMLLHRAHKLARTHVYGSRGSSSETAALLSNDSCEMEDGGHDGQRYTENIPLDTFPTTQTDIENQSPSAGNNNFNLSSRTTFGGGERLLLSDEDESSFTSSAAITSDPDSVTEMESCFIQHSQD